MIVDGDFILWESNTICRYLAGRAGRSDLLPAEPQARARVEQWMDWQTTELHAAWRYAFLAIVRNRPARPDPKAVAASVAAWNRHMEILERQLERTGAYAAGAEFTLADVALGVSAHRWIATPIELAEAAGSAGVLRPPRRAAGVRPPRARQHALSAIRTYPSHSESGCGTALPILR